MSDEVVQSEASPFLLDGLVLNARESPFVSPVITAN